MAAEAVLPFVVVSGLYVMNVRLPLAGEGWSLALVVPVTGTVSASMLVLLRLGRWLLGWAWRLGAIVGRHSRVASGS